MEKFLIVVYLLMGISLYSGCDNDGSSPADNAGQVDSVSRGTINGTNRSEKLFGTEYDDTINGLKGHDKIYGGAGNNKLNGGPGNDDLYVSYYSTKNYNYSVAHGGPGNDYIRGGVGDDRLYGGKGNDYIISDGGINRIYPESGNNAVFMDNYDEGTTTVQLTNGNDIIGISITTSDRYIGVTVKKGNNLKGTKTVLIGRSDYNNDIILISPPEYHSTYTRFSVTCNGKECADIVYEGYTSRLNTQKWIARPAVVSYWEMQNTMTSHVGPVGTDW